MFAHWTRKNFSQACDDKIFRHLTDRDVGRQDKATINITPNRRQNLFLTTPDNRHVARLPAAKLPTDTEQCVLINAGYK